MNKTLSLPQKTLGQWKENKKQIIMVNCGKFNDLDFHRISCVQIEHVLKGLWREGCGSGNVS